MSDIAQVGYPTAEPVTVDEQKNFSKVFVTGDDELIADLITAARSYVEDMTGLCLCSRDFIQLEDSLPMIPYGFSGYAYNASMNAYFGYGPVTPYPPMGWSPRSNPFELQLYRNPVTNVDHIDYIDSRGNHQTLLPNTDFVVDLVSVPARICPLPGDRWPQGMTGAGNVRIYFTAGNSNDPLGTKSITVSGAPTPPDQETGAMTIVTGIPRALKICIMTLASTWYSNREAVASGSVTNIPHSVDALIKAYRVLNLQPVTRY